MVPPSPWIPGKGKQWIMQDPTDRRVWLLSSSALAARYASAAALASVVEAASVV